MHNFTRAYKAPTTNKSRAPRINLATKIFALQLDTKKVFSYNNSIFTNLQENHYGIFF